MILWLFVFLLLYNSTHNSLLSQRLNRIYIYMQFLLEPCAGLDTLIFVLSAKQFLYAYTLSCRRTCCMVRHPVLVRQFKKNIVFRKINQMWKLFFVLSSRLRCSLIIRVSDCVLVCIRVSLSPPPHILCYFSLNAFPYYNSY